MTQFTCKGVKQINNRISLNMTFTFALCISRCFSSAREFQMGNFQKYWSQNVGQDFIVFDFFHGRTILEVDGRDGRDPQNRKKNAPAGRFTCMHVWHSVFLSKVFITMSTHYHYVQIAFQYKMTFHFQSSLIEYTTLVIVCHFEHCWSA